MAEPLVREALETRRRTLGDDGPDTLISISNMSGLLRDLGRLSEANALGAESIERSKRVLGSRHWFVGIFISRHAPTLVALEEFEEAERHYLESHDILAETLGPEHNRTQTVVQAIIDLYDLLHAQRPSAGYADEAERWRGMRTGADLLPADG